MTKALSTKRILLLILVGHALLNLHALWIPYYNNNEATNWVFARLVYDGDLSLKDFLGSTYLIPHYIFIWFYQFFPTANLLPIHIFHVLWKSGTILALYFTGKALKDTRCGLWAAACYAVGSMCFMTKDFHTTSAESFSLLPSTLAMGLWFHYGKKSDAKTLLAIGGLTTIATFCKAPSGILLPLFGIAILFIHPKRIQSLFFLALGFLVIFILPILMLGDLPAALAAFQARLYETQTVYIGANPNVSLLYVVCKLIVRTLLILIAQFPVAVFAIYALLAGKKNSLFTQSPYAQNLTLTFLWLIAALGIATIGGRIFYPYLIFTLAPIALLAGFGVSYFDDQNSKSQFLHFVRRHLITLLIVFGLVSTIDGTFRFSREWPDYPQAMAYIKAKTKPEQSVYFWAKMPRFYFLTDRKPPLTWFWVDTMLGFIPAPPAMEFELLHPEIKQNLWQKTWQDIFTSYAHKHLIPKPKAEPPVEPIAEGQSNLPTLLNLRDHPENPYWQKVMIGLLQNPPELFVDLAPTNDFDIGYFPPSKFEFFKLYLAQFYHLETEIDGVRIYRKNQPSNL